MNNFADFHANRVGEVSAGYLSRNTSSEYIPFYNHLLFLSEQSIIEEQVKKFLQNTLPRQIRPVAEYEQYLLKKSSRPVYDLYACFQPFNESLKALYPFFSFLKKNLKKGDIILNLWDRSGWISSLLCGIFPDQQVVSTWEGNKDVLGYSGYHYWFRHQENFRILFTEDYSHLPFADHTVGAVIGYDFFHRTNQVKLLRELERITRQDSVMIFPHIHLSNSEPEPFFERGCQQYHGTDYARSFEKRDAGFGRKTSVFSEPELFLFNDFHGEKPCSVPDTTDYNALVINLPAGKDPDLLPFFVEASVDNAYAMVNPLIKIEYSFGKTRLDPGSFGGNLKKLLERHPVYLERIKKAVDLNLDEDSLKLLFLAAQVYPLKAIREHLQLSEPVFTRYIQEYEEAGLLHVVPVNESGIRLQNFLMNQNYRFPAKEQTLAALWQRACSFFPERVFLTDTEDDSVYTYENADEIVQLIGSTLAGKGLKKGDRVLIYGKQSPEGVFLFLSCMLLGIVVIPLNEGLAGEAVSTVLTRTRPGLCFLGHREMEEQGHLFSREEVVLFDEGDKQSPHRLFSDWIEENSIPVEYPSTEPEDDCVILFTSGSTGLPKGIPVSHGRLFRSGELMSKRFDWGEEDRFISMGNLGSMSGLRNSVVVPLFKGSATVINAYPDLLVLGELIQKYEVSILGANPALLSHLVTHQEHFRSCLKPVKKILCTGNNLPGSLKRSFNDLFGLQIMNYYGLTETTGICIAEAPGELNDEDNFLGYPEGCIAQVVDVNGRVLGPDEAGELRVFSENLFDHYLHNTDESLLKNGWLYTGDTALIREDGSVKLIGRNSDIYKTKDEQLVYLSAVESFLKNKPEIKDACVILRGSDDLVIFISGDIPGRTVREGVKEKFNLVIPDEKIIFRESLPYNSQGKIDRNLL